MKNPKVKAASQMREPRHCLVSSVSLTMREEVESTSCSCRMVVSRKEIVNAAKTNKQSITSGEEDSDFCFCLYATNAYIYAESLCPHGCC